MDEIDLCAEKEKWVMIEVRFSRPATNFLVVSRSLAALHSHLD